MKIALSGRLWTAPQGFSLTLVQQIEIAAKLGYEGVEIRYPLVPAKEELEITRDVMTQRGIELAFIQVASLPVTSEEIRDVERVLEAVEFLGGSHIKFLPLNDCREEDVRRLADMSAERNIRALTQLHSNIRTDTVARTEDFLARMDHPNLGLIFDACHLPFSESTSIEAALQRLRTWTEIVNLQSYKPALPEDGLEHVTINGADWSLALPEDPAGTDLRQTMTLLRDLKFDGWCVVMPAVDPGDEPLNVARAYRSFLDKALTEISA